MGGGIAALPGAPQPVGRSRGAGAMIGIIGVAAATGAAGFLIGSAVTGSASPGSPLSLASLAVGEWDCRSEDGASLDIALDTAGPSGSAGVKVSNDGSSQSVQVNQTGDADVRALAEGLLTAMGEQGSISLERTDANGPLPPLSLTWSIDPDLVQLRWSDGGLTQEATCARTP